MRERGKNPQDSGGIEDSHEIRLPSETEWEKAARGTDGRIYPYGNTFDAHRGNVWETEIRRTSAVGLFPGDELPHGLFDTFGNVFDWCLTQWRSTYDEPENNQPEGSAGRVVRGGSWDDDRRDARVAYRDHGNPNNGLNCFGFRVAFGVRPPSHD